MVEPGRRPTWAASEGDMDLIPIVSGIVVTNLSVLLGSCVLAFVRTRRERRRSAPPSRRGGLPVGSAPGRARPAGHGSA